MCNSPKSKISLATFDEHLDWERYWADPELRLQYDLDLYCPENTVAARDALQKIGYESIPSDGRVSRTPGNLRGARQSRLVV